MTIRLLSKLLLFVLAIGVIVSPTVAKTQDTSPQQRLCEIYENLYDGANKKLAAIAAEGILDDSAPRETNRQTRALNQRIFQLILIFQMQAHKCDIPKFPSSGTGYMADALECQTRLMFGPSEHPDCDRSKWTYIQNDLENSR